MDRDDEEAPMHKDVVQLAPTYAQILEAVCSEFARYARGGATLDEGTDITVDLDIDSVAVMDMLFVLEERYEISIPLNELNGVQTIGELARLVHRTVHGK